MQVEAESRSCNPAAGFEHKVDITRISTIGPPVACSSPGQQPLLEYARNSSGHQNLSFSKPSLGGRLLRQAGASVRLCAGCYSAAFTYICLGFQWAVSFAALFLYGLLIFPGIAQVAWQYFFDKRVHRNISYGDGPRNRLDLYIPSENFGNSKPVVAFVTGGAWTIGYKAWGSLLALRLLDQDVIVACIDYRNFPQGTIGDMVEDVSQGISFVCNNISNYGGDTNRMYLVGQSAGAHLAACALMEQVKKELHNGHNQVSNEDEQDPLLWKASQFKAYIGLSGGYNLYKLADHIRQKAIFSSLFLSIMEGEGSLLRYSPELCLQSLSNGNLREVLPPICLLHGTDDHSIPHEASTSFAEALLSSGCQATIILYEGKSHTDLFLQDPMRGGRDKVLEDMLIVMNLIDLEGSGKHVIRLHRRLVPELFLQLARKISPF